MNNNGGLHLEVEQVPLKQIFRIIESQTCVRLHVSLMPERLVTATCAGATLEVLKCLLGKDVNLIYQYADKSSSNSTPLLAEVWVLNSDSSGKHQLLRDTRNQVICGTTENPNKVGQQQAFADEQMALPSLKQVETEKLFELARSTNPMQREEALSRLALMDQADDNGIREILEDALQDQNSSVRAQAVSGLARRNSPEIDSVLREALHDSDVGVRLMAVSNAGENIYLLESALNDTDRIVRDLASMKLDQILKIDIGQ
jgi:hypothetical protein